MTAWPQATNAVTDAMEGEWWDIFSLHYFFQWCMISGIFGPQLHHCPLPPSGSLFLLSTFIQDFLFPNLLSPPPKGMISCDPWRGSYKAVVNLKLWNVSLICFHSIQFFKVHTKDDYLLLRTNHGSTCVAGTELRRIEHAKKIQLLP